MRLQGEVTQHKISILVNSGSTLSFISENTAQALSCELEAVKPLLVRVANGSKMVRYKSQGIPVVHATKPLYLLS